jgi:hypothetical protein
VDAGYDVTGPDWYLRAWLALRFAGMAQDDAEFVRGLLHGEHAPSREEVGRVEVILRRVDASLNRWRTVA